ncbi:MAG: DEAD/DEAH box helicase family protein [Nitrosopumilus sp.]|nr:DEAD/DEAH box helicase family protein [Nitrosopumilus sp.]MDA7957850.1 DEAD/DEAH box helicase family protein [Nitrosopumilus sp.]
MMELITHREVIALQAPTGAGKTVIMTRFIDKFLETNPNKYAYIWASPRVELPKQSREKFERFFQDTGELTTILRSEILNYIERDCIWFVNWEYLTSLINKDGENTQSLEYIIQNTKERGAEIVLIMDESHWGVETKHATKVKEAISIIDPEKRIHITATPKGDIIDDDPISHDEVREEGLIVNMIKQNINMANEDIQVNEKLIEEGIKQRQILKNKYDKHNISVNPLLLIQVPNDKVGNQLIEQTKNILSIHGITEKDQNLLIWTADSNVHENDIRENTSQIDALIFKQVVSLGWDCPRAQVLVGLRTLKDDSFGIQTLGRIIRTAEQKHYIEDEDLNNCYLYTSSSILKSDNKMITNILDTKSLSLKNDIDTKLNLPRYHPIKPELIDFDHDFNEIFLKFSMEAKHNKKNTAQAMKHNVKYRSTTIPTNVNVNTDTKYNEADVNIDSATFRENYTDLYKSLQNYVKDTIMYMKYSDLFNYRTITEFLADGIYELFRNTGYKYEQPKITNIVLGSEENKTLLNHDLKKTLETLKNRMVSIDKTKTYDWNIDFRQRITVERDPVPNGEKHPYAAKDYTEQFGKYIMRPAYMKIESMIELYFCRQLNRASGVKWWYKNDTTKNSFGIPYIKNDKYHTFMPDFIVKMMDDRIGIFDTKEGNTLETALEKAEALADYIKDHKNLKMFGGIVTILDTRWKVHSSKPFSSNMSDPGWQDLDLGS